MAAAKKLRIVSVASEVAPYSKTGGLADVAKSLPKALSENGHTVYLITPFYKFMQQQNLNMVAVPGKATVSVGKTKYSITFNKLQYNRHLTILFIHNNQLFGSRSHIYGYPNDNLRFFVFNIATLKLIELLKLRPDVIHCHDWQTGLIPNFLSKHRNRYPSLKRTATLYTLHNLTYQMGSNWWEVPIKKIDPGRGDPTKTASQQIANLNFTKRGIVYADLINTVSERYAEEITTPELGQGLDRLLRQRKSDLYGIINGIDYAVNNPAFDNNLPYPFDVSSLSRKKKNKLALQKKVRLDQNPDIPLIGVVNRLTEQKGFRLIMESIDVLIRLPLQMVIVGSGFREYIAFFKRIAKKHPKKIGIYTPFTEELASLTYAGSDMFLMPSRFEPCGLSQLISLRYGSVPIVHETGGLSDTVTNFNPRTRKGNGFVFKHYSTADFLIAVARAMENYKYPSAWEELMRRGMQQTYSWELPAQKYVQLYALAKKNKSKRA
ncbi:MAG: glycogen synthase [Candidatus Kerfeldbacteria bacterium]|nr:glycogen synthase [Candidatus Kerfeldbacteria bacterium]